MSKQEKGKGIGKGQAKEEERGYGMKELDVFRYLKKYRAVIAGVSIFAGIAFFFGCAALYPAVYGSHRD